MKRITLPLLLLSSFLFAGCGQAPQKVEEQAHFPGDGHDHGPADAHGPNDGHNHGPNDGHDHGPGPGTATGEMPQDAVHAPFAGGGNGPAPQDQRVDNPHVMTSPGGDAYAGFVRLRGEPATGSKGYLFVSVVPAGTNSPLCFDRLALADDELGRVEGDERLIPFRYDMCQSTQGDVELKVQFDIDGYVDTKEEGILVGRFPIAKGDQGIDVTLE